MSKKLRQHKQEKHGKQKEVNLYYFNDGQEDAIDDMMRRKKAKKEKKE